MALSYIRGHAFICWLAVALGQGVVDEIQTFCLQTKKLRVQAMVLMALLVQGWVAKNVSVEGGGGAGYHVLSVVAVDLMVASEGHILQYCTQYHVGSCGVVQAGLVIMVSYSTTTAIVYGVSGSLFFFLIFLLVLLGLEPATR